MTDEYLHVAKRSSIAQPSSNPDEEYATQFALALLMPEQEVRRMRSETDSVVLLAYHFGVPAEVMHRRLKDLHLLADRSAEG